MSSNPLFGKSPSNSTPPYFFYLYLQFAEKKSPIILTKIYLELNKLCIVYVYIFESSHEEYSFQSIFCGTTICPQNIQNTKIVKISRKKNVF